MDDETELALIERVLPRIEVLAISVREQEGTTAKLRIVVLKPQRWRAADWPSFYVFANTVIFPSTCAHVVGDLERLSVAARGVDALTAETAPDVVRCVVVAEHGATICDVAVPPRARG